MADERHSRLLSEHRPVADAQQRDARGPAAALVVEMHGGRDADQREISVTPRNFLKRESAARPGGRNSNLRQELAGLYCCREQSDEKLGCAHIPYARFAADR